MVPGMKERMANPEVKVDPCRSRSGFYKNRQGQQEQVYVKEMDGAVAWSGWNSCVCWSLELVVSSRWQAPTVSIPRRHMMGCNKFLPISLPSFLPTWSSRGNGERWCNDCVVLFAVRAATTCGEARATVCARARRRAMAHVLGQATRGTWHPH